MSRAVRSAVAERGGRCDAAGRAGRRGAGQGRAGHGRDDRRCPTPDRARRSSRCRPAASATPTCTTGRARSTTSSRSCSATRPPGIVEAVGPDVTSVAPGDFVILTWRAVCGECRSCRRGRPWYCFATHNAHPEDDPRRRRAHARARHRRLRREDAGRRRPGHQGRPAGQARGRRPPRLRRHGRPRRGDAHRRGRPGRHGGRVRLRRRGRRRHRRGPAGRRPTIIAVDLDAGKLEWPASSAPPTRSTRRRPTRSRRSRRSPTATAPTCASRRSATPR